jgi:hypothetical protein
MNQETEKPLLLADTLSAFAAELRQLLRERGEAALAESVSTLMILDRCRCKDEICATFYTQPKPKDHFGPGHRNVVLAPENGMLILDIVGTEIACVEVLYREEIRRKLNEVLPLQADFPRNFAPRQDLS